MYVVLESYQPMIHTITWLPYQYFVWFCYWIMSWHYSFCRMLTYSWNASFLAMVNHHAQFTSCNSSLIVDISTPLIIYLNFRYSILWLASVNYLSEDDPTHFWEFESNKVVNKVHLLLVFNVILPHWNFFNPFISKTLTLLIFSFDLWENIRNHDNLCFVST